MTVLQLREVLKKCEADIEEQRLSSPQYQYKKNLLSEIALFDAPLLDVFTDSGTQSGDEAQRLGEWGQNEVIAKLEALGFQVLINKLNMGCTNKEVQKHPYYQGWDIMIMHPVHTGGVFKKVEVKTSLGFDSEDILLKDYDTSYLQVWRGAEGGGIRKEGWYENGDVTYVIIYNAATGDVRIEERDVIAKWCDVNEDQTKVPGASEWCLGAKVPWKWLKTVERYFNIGAK
jgi:hypothetical protein